MSSDLLIEVDNNRQHTLMSRFFIQHHLLAVPLFSVLTLSNCSSIDELTSKQSDLVSIEVAKPLENSKQSYMLKNYTTRAPQLPRDWKEVNDEQTGI